LPVVTPIMGVGARNQVKGVDCEKEVKLLGVTIDCQLKFNTHISNICKKASRQLNVLKRIGKHLTKLGRLTSMTMYCHQHSYIKYFLLQN
jgi:hypothetical protein